VRWTVLYLFARNGNCVFDDGEAAVKTRNEARLTALVWRFRYTKYPTERERERERGAPR